MAGGTWKEPDVEKLEEEEHKASPGKAGFGMAAEKAKEEEEKKKKEAEEHKKIEDEENARKEDWERWGRYWIWEGYFNSEHQPHWEAAATRLLMVNDHVKQDIEDVILLAAFQGYDKKRISDRIE